jgi:hypothetical protein
VTAFFRTDIKSLERDAVLGVVARMSVACLPSWHQQSPANDHFRVRTHSRSASPDVGSGETFRSVIRSLLRSLSSFLEKVELVLDSVVEAAVVGVDMVEKASSG